MCEEYLRQGRSSLSIQALFFSSWIASFQLLCFKLGSIFVLKNLFCARLMHVVSVVMLLILVKVWVAHRVILLMLFYARLIDNVLNTLDKVFYCI